MAKPRSRHWQDNELAQALKYVREERNLRQEDVANRVAENSDTTLSANYYSMLERGERAPSDRTLGSILKAMNVSETEWLTIRQSKPWEDMGKPGLWSKKEMIANSRQSLAPESASFDNASLTSSEPLGFMSQSLASPQSSVPSSPIPQPTYQEMTDITELTRLWPNLSAEDQKTVLNLAKRLSN